MTVFALMAIFSVVGVQAEGNTAKIAETGTEYPTFEAAVTAAEAKQTVELLQDASFDGGLEIAKDLTIDGKGFTLTDVGASGAGTFSIKITSGTVTVKNITIKRTNQKANAFFWLPNDGATLTLSDNVTMDGIKGGNGAAVLLEGGGNCILNITGENVEMINCTGYFGAIGLTNKSVSVIDNVDISLTDASGTARNGIGLHSNAKLTMKSGKISGYKKAGIGLGNESWHKKMGAEAVIDIQSGVTIENCTTGIYMAGSPSVKMAGTITGGTTGINASSESGFEFAGTLDFSGKVENCTGNGILASGGTVNINGGEVTGGNNLILVDGDSAKLNVTGGIITSAGVCVNANKGTVNISGGMINTNGSAIYMAGAATAVVEMNGGTISGSNTAKGIHLASGTVNMKNGTIEKFESGIRVLGGTANVSGGTITDCKYGIEGKSGTVSMTDGTIENCRGASGDPGSGIRVYKDGTLSVNVSGGTITKNENGLQLVGNGDTATISGTVNITGNDSNIYIPGNCYLYISGTFSGKVGIKTGAKDDERMKNNVLKADDFGGLANLGCITNDYDGSRFGYHNGTNFAWTNNPEPATTADSGVYRTEEGGEELGVVRFITEFSAVNADAIESAGTYALNADTVKSSEIPEGTKFESFGSGFVAGANAYAVDVIKIAKSNFDKPVTAVSFVKIKSIDTPVYYIVSGAKVNIGKDLGINADSNFDAQEVTE